MSTDPGGHRASGASRPSGWARAAGVAAVALALVAGGGWWWWDGRADRHLERALRFLEDGRPESAAAWLAVPEADPRTEDRALLLRARVALMRGRPGDAIGPLDRIPEGGPLGAEVAFLKGEVLRATGNLPDAIAWFRRSLRRRPDDPDCLRSLAAASYDLGDLETVLQALQDLTRVLPGDSAAWRTLGLVRMELPDAGEQAMIEAVSAYRTSLGIDPHQPAVRLELADLLARQGAYSEALDQLDACRGRVPEADRLALLARISWERGDRSATASILDEARSHRLEHPELFALAGLLAQAEGRNDEAEGWFDLAVASAPFDFRRYVQRATFLRTLGRLDEADRDARRADELKQALLAMSSLNAEAAARPLDPDVRCRLGLLCEQLGKPQLAASWYRAALSCDPNHSDARSLLAELRR
ncbi:tetratricopeptide repeat protein [Tautonia sociabilis]|uniref:Tetratricopeptide repeat protein n=1 Tax=Tautonia sociabilis TaxID=2080755 RepID=A0A432MK65_9BACT|nr:tetratricopeptide repeat protein [Tautonia sociabilis]RUL87575.1 tetratricopeptide repeat protein [Tautonia sociabilis]